MKIMPVLCISVCILVSATTSHAQKLTGIQIDRYATIAGGWWLNRECSYLADDLRQEFEWHVAKLTGAFRERGMNEGYLRAIQNGARKTATEKGCGPQSSEIVIATVTMARDLNKELTGAGYSKVGALREYQAKRFLGISAAAAVERICKFGPEKGRATFLKLTEALAAKMPPQLGQRAKQLQSKIQNAGPPCTAKTERMVLNSFNEAKALGVDLGVWSTETGLLPQ